jgi:hypothetical protein
MKALKQVATEHQQAWRLALRFGILLTPAAYTNSAPPAGSARHQGLSAR